MEGFGGDKLGYSVVKSVYELSCLDKCIRLETNFDKVEFRKLNLMRFDRVVRVNFDEKALIQSL